MEEGRTFVSPEVEADYQRLMDLLRKFHPAEDLSMVEKAFWLASDAHEGQLRQSGEPYLIHPLKVAITLAGLQLDLETVEGGLLHDVVEDTKISKEEIAAQFGDDVALLVDGVTKLKTLTYTTNDKVEIQAENYRKMFIAMARDIRVILIKLADRLHNLQTLEYKSHEKQLEKARETLDIYAPIANRLGISKIKINLEDLSLKYLYPAAYADLTRQISQRREKREEFIAGICARINEELEKNGIKATVEGRPKHFFSIYKKMVNKGKTLDQIYDLFAVRAIVDSVKDCYGALGVIHDMYTPIPGRFKDYIAMPKPNMYQSLHTTLIGPTGEPFEVQIRTWEMHRIAEYGIAAHWKYKEDQEANANRTEKDKMVWLQKILEWQDNLSDNREFISVLRQDLDAFAESVFVFSPKGDVVELPVGSTPIDFAYQIHSAVGNKMVGARADGRLVPLSYKVRNGERIEIITSQNSKGPSRDWLSIVKTTQARNKIMQWFKKEQKQDDIQHGKDLCEKYAKGKNIPWPELQKPEWIQIITRKYGFGDWDSLLAAIGHGGIKEGQIVNRLYEEYRKETLNNMTDEDVIKLVPDKEAAASSPNSIHKGGAIIVKGLHDLAVRFSRCCNPVPGDEIVGYITRGRGVSIHRTDCVNMIMLPEEERKRLIEAEWEVTVSDGLKFKTNLQIVGEERLGLLVDISSVINSLGMTILSLDARVNKEQTQGLINISLEISSKSQLDQIINKLMHIRGVKDIVRLTQ